MHNNVPTIKTLGELKQSGYASRSVKDELRENLIKKLRNDEPVFEGIWGYEDTVIPDVQRAILSRHNINLLGLRGQAKTRIAREMVSLLDEYIPVIEGTELNDDPLDPVSVFGKEQLAALGDDMPVTWMHRSERYSEKLATPDVAVADLIGDVDPIKAANLKLSYADERVIHYGIIPRSNRGIFVINELPDLQARIQVALFNILQEKDIQIRGFKLRLNLDVQFLFTANPEDYTNRGSIITPLKDRIESQILTHYPKDMETARRITDQEAAITENQQSVVNVSDFARNLIEQIVFEARNSEYVDPKSGVSARLSISALENLVSAAERRALLNGESGTAVRITDFWGLIPAITGKIELVYEGEQEGPLIVAQNLIEKAIRTLFVKYFPDPEKEKKVHYGSITEWFGQGQELDFYNDMPNESYEALLHKVPGLGSIVKKYWPDAGTSEQLLGMEFVLHGLAAHSMINKDRLQKGFHFKDLLSAVFSFEDDPDEPGGDR